MKSIHVAIAALAAAVPAAAQGPVSVSPFDSVELQGGGHVTLRHGAEQRVSLVRGDPSMTRFTVEDGRLEIDSCIRDCRDYDLEIEIVTPDLEALAIRGGGSIRVEGAFPEREDLAVAVTGGGALDALQIGANHVAAAVTGGGLIRTHAVRNLAASVRGGGSVRYRGDPETVVSIHGGGSVNRDSSR